MYHKFPFGSCKGSIQPTACLNSNACRLPTDFSQVIYSVGVREGSVEEWDHVWLKAQETQNPSEREMLLEALAHTQKPWLLWRYCRLNFSCAYHCRLKIYSWMFFKCLRELLFTFCCVEAGWSSFCAEFCVLCDRGNCSSYQTVYPDCFQVITEKVVQVINIVHIRVGPCWLFTWDRLCTPKTDSSEVRSLQHSIEGKPSRTISHKLKMYAS